MSSLSLATYKLPFLLSVEPGSFAPFGSLPAVLITAAINASGVTGEIPEVVASKPVSIAHLSLDASYANNSPIFCVPCCTTIPPSPAESEPEANSTNLSDTNKFSVFWNDAVPLTVKSPEIIISSENVLSPVIVSASP